jgi:hypothetical protein
VQESLQTDRNVTQEDTGDYKTSEVISEAVLIMALRELMLSYEEHRK